MKKRKTVGGGGERKKKDLLSSKGGPESFGEDYGVGGSKGLREEFLEKKESKIKLRIKWCL